MEKIDSENWRKEENQRDTILLDYTKWPQGIKAIYQGKFMVKPGKLILSTCFSNYLQNSHLTRGSVMLGLHCWPHDGNGDVNATG